MICCDICEEWYHLKCLGIDSELTTLSEVYHCQICTKQVEVPDWHLKKMRKNYKEKARLSREVSLRASLTSSPIQKVKPPPPKYLISQESYFKDTEYTLKSAILRVSEPIYLSK